MKTVLIETSETIESSEQRIKILQIETSDITILLDEKKEEITAILRYPERFRM
jgi:hypothetical protein